MVSMATNRTATERRALAEFLTGKRFGTALTTSPSPAAMCRARNRSFDPAAGPRWTAWGEHEQHTVPGCRRGPPHRRRRAAAEAQMGIRVPWRSAVVQPGDARGRPPLRRQLGRQGLLARCVHRMRALVLRCRRGRALGHLDRESGSRHIAVFGDMAANVFALDAVTGQLIWRVKVDDFPVARVSASPTVHNGRIYVGRGVRRRRCRARFPRTNAAGFAAAWSRSTLATGKQIWKTFLIRRAEADEEERRRRAAVGTLRRACLGDAGRRCSPQCALRHDREQLLRSRRRR